MKPAGVDANGRPIPSPNGVINPPVKNEVGLPFIGKTPWFAPVEFRSRVRKPSHG